MTLTLPSDLEKFTDDYTASGIYALDIQKPDNLEVEWDRRFEHRAAWFEEFAAAEHVVYVGAAKNLLSRLEDHRDGQVRQAILPSLAVDMTLRNVWLRPDMDTAMQDESRIAIRLRNHLPETYFVRQA